MERPSPTTSTDKYYFYDDSSRIIYYSEEMSEDPHLIYIGTSDNPNFSMAAQAFVQKSGIQTGYKLRSLDA